MRAIFFWRTTSEVDLEHLAERDGIRWRWRDVEPGEERVLVMGDAPRVTTFFRHRLLLLSNVRPVASVFVEETLSAQVAVDAWRKGGEP